MFSKMTALSAGKLTAARRLLLGPSCLSFTSNSVRMLALGIVTP